MQSNRERPLKIALVGGGGIARKAYLPFLRTHPEASIVALFSRTQKTIDEVCSRWQLDFGTTDFDGLIHRQPDAAFVLTSTPSHFELTKRLLEAGIDVYVEKPATEYSNQARELAKLADRLNRVLMVGFNRRYALLYRQAKTIFGDRSMNLCVVEKHRPSAYHISLYNNYLDDTIHQIDLLRFFCGEARAVHTSVLYEGGKLVGATSITSLTKGGLGVIHSSLQAGGWQERVTLHGGGLSIQVNAFREIIVREGDHQTIYGVDRAGRWMPQLRERGFTGAIEHFFDCVRNRTQPETNAHDAARTEELVESLTKVAGEEVRVKPMVGWGQMPSSTKRQ